MNAALRLRPRARLEPVTRPRRRRSRLVPALPIAVLVIFVLVALLAPWLTPHDPVFQDLTKRLLPPAWVDGGSSEYLLGTDELGRDILTRLCYGAQVSLAVVLLSLSIALALGTLVGMVAGYAGGWVDSVLMRVVDIMLALPSLLIAMVVAAAVGPSFRNLVLILGLLIWPNIARLIRAETLVLRQQDYVGYARSTRSPRRLIVRRHLFPNVLPTLLVATTLEIANVVMTEASLSFLGVGLPPPQASWGVMIDDGRALLATGWWIALFPGLALLVTVYSFNTLGDWLRDRFDPKLAEG